MNSLAFSLVMLDTQLVTVYNINIVAFSFLPPKRFSLYALANSVLWFTNRMAKRMCIKVTPHDGNPFHQNAHRALNFQVFPLKFRMHNNKSLLWLTICRKFYIFKNCTCYGLLLKIWRPLLRREIRTLLIYLKGFRNIIFPISNDQRTKLCSRFLTGIVFALI
jgi:hypothetical protein